MERWYVLFCKPRQEFHVRDQLSQKRFEPYLPVLPDPPQRPPQPSRRRARRPLFPRYLFVRLDLTRTSPDVIRWTPGLCSFVTFGDAFATVGDEVIVHIERRLSQWRQEQRQPFRPGERVRLRPDHPLGALDAVFERPLSDGARAQILLDFLGRLSRCQVAMEDLRPVEAPVWA